MRHAQRTTNYLLVVIWTFSRVTSAYSCDIPVFQYALDYWEPDSFEILVYHHGEFDKESQAIVDRFQSSVESDQSILNFTVDTIEVSEGSLDELDTEIAFNLKEGESIVAVLSPPSPKPQSIIWRGPLSEETYLRIVESPLRKKMGEQLVSGTSAVWVLLETGDTERDEAAFETLQSQLPQLAETLELPGEPDPTVENPLSFAIERLSRENVEETFLIEMLLSVEPDLRDEEFEGLPMVFPIFGRARVLYALIGEGINPDTIKEACGFLTGACSCEIKDLNPGADLLLGMDWNSAVAETVREMEEDKVLVTSDLRGNVEAPAAVVGKPVFKNLTLVVSVLMGIVALGTLALFWRGQSS